MSEEITDTERLDWIEKQGNGDKWLARQSNHLRGFRLHNTTQEDQDTYITARAAIDHAMSQEP